jgi:large subunit ribosomal protein L24
MKIKKGDNVIVIAGGSKGKKGKVLKAFPTLNQVVVEGVNMKKKSMKARTRGGKGSIIELAMPINVSNVSKQ